MANTVSSILLCLTVVVLLETPSSSYEFFEDIAAEDSYLLETKFNYTWSLFAVFPTGGKLFYRQELMRPALDYAVQQINNQSIASEFLKITYIGTKDLTTCQHMDDLATYKVIVDVTQSVIQDRYKQIELVPVAYIGTGCAKSVEDIAKWLNAQGQLPHFDGIATSYNLKNRTEFPSLIRTGHTEDRFLMFHDKMIDHFGWNASAAVFFVDRSDPVFQTIFAPIGRRLDAKESLWRVVPIEHYCSKKSSSADPYPFEGVFTSTEYKERLEYHTTAIVIFANMACVKSILIEAVRQNLISPPDHTEPHQMTFIVNNLFDTAYWGTLDITANDTLLPEERNALLTAYRQTFTASYYVGDRLEQAIEEFTATLLQFVLDNKDKYNSGEEPALRAEKINPTVLNYYAAVHIYAQAMKAVFVAANESDMEDRDRKDLYTKDGQIISTILKTKSFTVPYVGTVDLNEHGDVLGNFAVNYYSHIEGTFTTWLLFSEHAVDLDEQVDHHYQAARWPVPYPTVPPTSATQTDAPSSDYITWLIGMAAVVVLIVVISGFVIKYYVMKSRLTDKWWVIDPQALRYLKGADNDKAMAARAHDTRTMKSMRSENFTFAEYLHHESDSMRLAKFQGHIVAVHIMTRKWSLGRSLLEDLRKVRLNSHVNLLKFYGICVENGLYCTVTDFAYRGSLRDMFIGPQTEMDWSLRYSLLIDLSEGLIFIHKTFGHHGTLTSYKCMIDRTFVLKVTGYAPKGLQEQITDLSDWDKLWTAPEILRKESVQEIEKMTEHESQKCDVFSFGIIMQEVIMQSPPYPGPDKMQFILPPPEIIDLVRNGSVTPPYRPLISPSANCDAACSELMESCWLEDPMARPTIGFVKTRLKSFRGESKGTLFDDLMERVQSYAGQLQLAVEERTQQLREEQHKIQALLYELLPKSVADRLISKRPVEPEPFDCVTIYFSDIVSFTTIAAESSAAQVVNMLNQLYQLFDGIIENYDAYKVETIGDAYMVVSGLPQRNGNEHAPCISKLALNILQAAGNFQIPHRPKEKFTIRIGVHSGACVAGVVGNKMPRYCLFGDTVNTASRMESTSEPNRVQLSGTTAQLIRDNPDFQLESRGPIEVKGKGKMETFWLTPSPSNSFPSPVLNGFSYMRRTTMGRGSRATLGERASTGFSYRGSKENIFG